MRKASAIGIGGLVGALCVSAALVATSIPGTGAWFTDSKAGSFAASSGHLTLNIDPETSTNLSFANLMPGTNVDKQIKYTTDVSSGGVDVWLVFNKDGAGYQNFTGGKNSPNSPGGGLGRYGFFQVSDTHGGQAFVTGNLAYPDYSSPGQENVWATGMCPTNPSTGRGGSAQTATGPTDYPPRCGVPDKILLASNLPTGTDGTVTFTFGLNGPLQTEQNQYEGTVNFNLVATQTGHTP